MMIFAPFAGGSMTRVAGVGEFVMANGVQGQSSPPIVPGVGGSIGITVSTIRVGV